MFALRVKLKNCMTVRRQFAQGIGARNLFAGLILKVNVDLGVPRLRLCWPGRLRIGGAKRPRRRSHVGVTCLHPSGPLPNASVEARTRLGVRLCAAMQRLPQTSRRASGPRGAFSAKGRDAGLRIHLLVPVGTEGQRGTSILNGTSHMNSGTGYSLRAPPARGHWSANYGHIRTRDSLVDAVPFA